MGQMWADLEGHGFLWGVVWVLEKNGAAQRFYERQGLHRDGGRRGVVHGGRRVVVVRYSQALNRFDPMAELGQVVTRR